MKITVIKEDTVKTSSWAGGESKQYFIYPPTADYAARNCNVMMSVVDKNVMITTNDFCETCNKKYNWLAFFCGCGYASFKLLNDEIFSISKGDLILFEDISSELKINVSLEHSKLIRMDICC
ncbi:MAG: hypothetical protein WBJ13_07285 [Sedimentibacter sp.]